MPIFQPDIGDTINKTTFELRVPDDYETTIPGYYQKFPERIPIYQGETDLAFTYLPIARMIDMCNTNVPFTVVHVEDVVTICNLITKYISALVGITAKDAPDTSINKIWIRRSTKALQIFEEHGQMATADIIRDHVYEEAPDLVNIFSKIGGML
jgi:hypothetical protein